MRTLKSMSIPEDAHYLLAWAENYAYCVKIRYFGEGDLTIKRIEEISGSDLIISAYPKEDIYPDLSITLEDEKAGIEQHFFVELQYKDIVGLDQIDSFIEAVRIAGDTLADIKDMLTDLGPQFVHAEPESSEEESIISLQCEERTESMKTLKYLPIPKDNPRLLAWAENGVYDVKIRYFGDQDPAAVRRSELTAEDLMINVHNKYKNFMICPALKMTLGNKDLGTRQWFYIQLNNMGIVFLEEMSEFLRLLEVAKDTLTDIREMLMELIPDYIQ